MIGVGVGPTKLAYTLTLGNFIQTLGAARAAYSLFKVNDNYSGNCCRVTTAGGTQTNIGFVNGVVDEAALLTAAGGGDLYIRSFFDQSGNTRDATLSSFSTAYAGLIVDDGVIVRDIYGNPGFKNDGNGVNPGANFFMGNSTMFPAGSRTVIAFVQPSPNIPNGAVVSTGFQSGGISHGLAYSNNFGSYGGVMFWAGGGATASLIQSKGGKPELIIAVTDHTNNVGTIYQNGMAGMVDTPLLTPYTPSQQGYIARDTSSAQNYKGIINTIIVYDGAMAHGWCANAYAIGCEKFSIPEAEYIAMDGDSLTQGNGTVSSLQSNWSQRLQLILTDTRPQVFYNDGKGGDGITQMISEAVTPRTGLDYLKFLVPEPNLTFVGWGGTGEIVQIGFTPANTYPLAVQWCAARKAAFPNARVAWVTTLPRGAMGSGLTTEIFQFNDLLVAGMSGDLGDVCDIMIDVRDCPEFDEDGDQNNETYFDDDDIHLIIAGYDALVPLFKTKLGLT